MVSLRCMPAGKTILLMRLAQKYGAGVLGGEVSPPSERVHVGSV